MSAPEPASGQRGFALVEVLIAIALLAIGVFGVFMAFAAAQKLSVINERHTTMAHVAQREIERLEGIAYSRLEMTAAPPTSADPTNPDYNVTAGSPPSFAHNTSGSPEQLVIDSSNGVVDHTASWSEGQFSGTVYDYVTWVTDPRCAPGCTATDDYKRLTVAVTINDGHPAPVYNSSVISDPHAEPIGGISNGLTGNPLTDPSTQCVGSNGVPAPCTSPIDSGNPNTYFLHDSPATSATPVAPSADHATPATVGTVSGQTCTTSTVLATVPANTTGCPTPDLMDGNPPAGDSTTPLYHYSTDQCSDSCYPGGQLLQPTCSNGTGCGAGSSSDCSGGAWTNSLNNTQSAFWVTAPLTAAMTLTGDGGISLFSQSVGGTSPVVSFCLEVYDVPPSGTAGSLSDLLAWPPVALGGAAYVPPADPSTQTNWPTQTSDLSYSFNFRGSSGSASIPAGDRIGVRLWFKATYNTALAFVFDNPTYPTEVQLNAQ
jgi:prepilin-type N-terminal cleavage/methylation domain-containing protein